MQILRTAVEKSKEVRIESNSKGYILSSYQDKIGTLQSISWYMGDHCDGRNEYMSMSIRNKDGSEGGWLCLKFDDIDTVEITASKGDFTYITINNSLKIYVKK